MRDAHSVIEFIGLDGRKQKELKLPDIGSAEGFDGKRADTETFYSFTGFTDPSTIYRYDVATGESTLFKRPNVAFETRCTRQEGGGDQ